jgi:glycerol-3-phosphate acyltransferase PlsY
MSLHTLLGILCATAYLLGAIPFGLLVGRMRGVDIRQHGSKNIGATNAGRVLGKKFFWVVFVLDVLKGAIPVAVASGLIARGSGPESELTMLTYGLWIGVGLAAFLGHVFPVYLGFRGGKGVATGLGVVLGLWPYFTVCGLVAAGVFVVVFLLTRFVSLGSVIAAGAFPIAFVGMGQYRGWDVFGTMLPLTIVSSAIALLIVVRHRANIKRLVSGTELRIESKK